MASMCSNCRTCPESSFHLFLQLVAFILNFPLCFNDLSDIWKVCDRRWTPQCKIVIPACLVNIINTIWYTRNQARFQNKIIHWKAAINLIISRNAISGNNTNKTSVVDITEFVILKALKINIHPPRAPIIKEEIWLPPLANWLKVNTNGAVTKKSPESCLWWHF